MKFEVDKQTKKDLEIFDTVKNGTSVFRLFDFTRYLGGKRKLYNLLANPTSNLEDVIDRIEATRFLQKHFPNGMEVYKDSIDFTEYYYKHGKFPTNTPNRFTAIERKIMSRISLNNDYYLIESGVKSIIDLLKTVNSFIQEVAEVLKKDNTSTLVKSHVDEVKKIFSRGEYKEILRSGKTTAYEIAKFDYMFRYNNKKEIIAIIDLIYEYDVFQSVIKATKENNLTFPEMLPKENNTLEAEGLFHPFVKNAITNDIRFENSSNLLFISGPNMAGKSTFLKALGVAVYLAHIGFPVPAAKLRISVLSGLCSTINLSDNLSSGYSHFYAEVMRVKYVAERLKQENNMLVLFDELFRGTNVKDAYDGTLAIVSAFAKIRTSFFVISTHIVEVAKELAAHHNINFSYFEIKEQDGHPSYTYKLKNGVSEDRLGMYIIRKEGLIDLINDISKS